MVLIIAIILFVLFHLIESELRNRRQQPHVQENCPRCEQEVSSDHLLCPDCKTLLRKHCRECGRSRSVQHQFCPWCGNEQRSEVLDV